MKTLVEFLVGLIVLLTASSAVLGFIFGIVWLVEYLQGEDALTFFTIFAAMLSIVIGCMTLGREILELREALNDRST